MASLKTKIVVSPVAVLVIAVAPVTMGTLRIGS
jgi:hypothetical protein